MVLLGVLVVCGGGFGWFLGFFFVDGGVERLVYLCSVLKYCCSVVRVLFGCIFGGGLYEVEMICVVILVNLFMFLEFVLLLFWVLFLFGNKILVFGLYLVF